MRRADFHYDLPQQLIALYPPEQRGSSRMLCLDPGSDSLRDCSFRDLPALLNPGDTILGMSLADGGHLTHGAKPNQSGKWFNAIQYGVRQQDLRLDYDQVAELAGQWLGGRRGARDPATRGQTK